MRETVKETQKQQSDDCSEITAAEDPTSVPEEEPKQEMHKYGSIRNVVNGSGLIQGPKSGYPVYMNGGMTPSFIGHGTEFVASKVKWWFCHSN